MPASVITAIPALPALLLGFWLMQTGNTFQGTILSIRGEIEGFTLAQIGAVGAGFWAGVIIGSLRAAGVISGLATFELSRPLEQSPPPRRSCTFLWWIRSCG